MEKYSIMSLNLMCDLPFYTGHKKFKNRAKAINELVRWNNPDFIGLQELTDDMIPLLDTLTKNYTFYGKARSRGFNLSNERCCILYKKDRFELVQGETFWLSNTPSIAGSRFKDSIYPRIATYVTLKDKKTNAIFSICNTHLDHLLPSVRTKQCLVLKKELLKKEHGDFLLLTGDFNTPLSSSALQGLFNNGNPLHLKDALPRFARSTLHSKIGSKAHKYKAIDHIFISDHLLIDKTQMISSLYMGVYPSDHLPIMTSFHTQK